MCRARRTWQWRPCCALAVKGDANVSFVLVSRSTRGFQSSKRRKLLSVSNTMVGLRFVSTECDR